MIEQKTLNQIVDHCKRCERCSEVARRLIETAGPFALDVDGFKQLDESIATCPNNIVEN